jgi:hypothetical protein
MPLIVDETKNWKRQPHHHIQIDLGSSERQDIGLPNSETSNTLAWAALQNGS